jgi:Effector protein
MKPALIGLAALGLAVTALLVAQPTGERPIPGLRTVNRGDGAKEKDKDEDRDKEKRRVLRPRFTVSSSKEAYDLSERIILTLTLSLNKHFSLKDTEEESSGEEVERRAPAQVTVETFEAGTINVVSATRDGKPIEPTGGVIRFEDDPVGIQGRLLATIGPGDRVKIPFNVPHLSSQGSRLVVVEVNPGVTNFTQIYSLQEPGLYTLQFRYHYTGPDDGKPDVFRGEILSNPVSFLLHETNHAGQEGGADGLECDGSDPAFLVTCLNAIEEIRLATPVGRTTVERLEQSANTHTITPTDVPLGSGTDAANEANAFNGKGTSTMMEWNPTDTARYADGTPRDPTSALLHELWHANVADTGGWSTETVQGSLPGIPIERDEIDASIVQNEHSRATDKPLRQKYCVEVDDAHKSCADIPQPSPGPSPGQ